jgi:predicted TIM-barrel fold metal-dependent hydrolase
MARGVKRFFGDPTPIQKNYLVADLLADAQDYELAASVHIQVGVAPDDELQETAWLQDISDSQGLPTALIPFCDLSDRNASLRLDAQRNYSGVRGVRQIVGRSDEEDATTGSGSLLDDPVWREHLALLGDLELSFDLQMTPGQASRAAEALAIASATQVAICHCGSPWDQTATGLASWRRGMRILAELPNVSCKISGLGMFDHDWTVDSIRPIVESCIEMFGADRCMFGSNFPVDKLHASYQRIWQAFETICSGMSQSDQERLFGGTARDFYRIA